MIKDCQDGSAWPVGVSYQRAMTWTGYGSDVVQMSVPCAAWEYIPSGHTFPRKKRECYYLLHRDIWEEIVEINNPIDFIFGKIIYVMLYTSNMQKIFKNMYFIYTCFHVYIY